VGSKVGSNVGNTNVGKNVGVNVGSVGERVEGANDGSSIEGKIVDVVGNNDGGVAIVGSEVVTLF
jgi:hypothetical protein